MPKAMKAAVVREFRKPLVIEEAAVPEPGRGPPCRSKATHSWKTMVRLHQIRSKLEIHGLFFR